jgi:ABC-2 type transport system ATP-binding protein
MSEAEHCDRLALMHGGKVLALATAEDMKRELEAEAGCLLEIRAEPLLPALQILEAEGFAGVALFGNALHLFSPRPEEDRDRIERALARGGTALRAVEAKRPSLEDVFVFRILAREKEEREAAAR